MPNGSLREANLLSRKLPETSPSEEFQENLTLTTPEKLPEILLKFPKPGKTEKNPKRLIRKTFLSGSFPIRDFPAYLKEIRSFPCIRCEYLEEKTVEAVPAHYTGFRQHALGKGIGIKVLDLFDAPLCRKCHLMFDEPEEKKSVELSEEFLYYIALCWMKVVSKVG